MADPSAPFDVRYGAGHDKELRDVLLQEWGGSCHLCERPKQFHEIQIDHLIPARLKGDPAALEKLIETHDLPGDFDLDRPANLAPACAARCNGEKSDRLLSGGVLDLRLQKAAERAPRVIAGVRGYATTTRVGRSLRVIRTSDLSDPAVRAAFERDAQTLVQQVALIDESKADFIGLRTVDLGLPGVTVDLLLNARGRMAVAVVEDLCGCSLHDALELAIDDLVTQIDQDAKDFLEGTGNDHRDRLRPADHEREWLRLSAGTVDFHRAGPDLAVTLEGRVEGLFTASMTGSVLGDTFGHPTGEVEVAGGFHLTLTWNLSSAPGTPPTRDSRVVDMRGITVIW